MFKTALKDLIVCLEKAQIDYMVIGGLAVAYYGEVRLTQDIDVAIDLLPSELNQLLLAIKNKFLPLVEDPESFVRETWVLPVKHKKTSIRVDVVFSGTFFEKKAILEAKKVEFEDVKIKFIPAEYLIVQKIIAGRARDVEDIKGIIKRQRQLDYEKITKILDSLSQELGETKWLELWKSLISVKLKR